MLTILTEFKEQDDKIQALQKEVKAAKKVLFSKGKEIFFKVTQIPGWEALLSRYYKRRFEDSDSDPEKFFNEMTEVRFRTDGNAFIMSEKEEGEYELYDVLYLTFDKSIEEHVHDTIKREREEQEQEKAKAEAAEAYVIKMRAKFEKECQELIAMGKTPYPNFLDWLKLQKD